MTATDVSIIEHDHLPWTLTTLRMALVAAIILLIPFRIYLEVPIDLHSPHLVGSGVQYTLLGPTDVLLVFLILACMPLFLKRTTYDRLPIGLLGAALFAVIVAIWLIMYPTVEGSMMLLRVLGIPAVIVAIRSMSQKNLMVGVVWPLMLGASFQALIALTQTFIWNTGMIVPATTLAEGRAWTAGLGHFSGPYALAAYLMLAMAVALSFGISKRPLNRRFDSIELNAPLRIALWTTVVLTSAAIATTFGRMTLLAIGFVGGTYFVGWLVRRQRIMAISALAVLAPMTVTGVVLRSGWLVRASQTASGDLTNRGALAARAIEMIRSSPLTGVGPVQYGPNLARMGLAVPDPLIVHNLPLLVSAEFGLVVGAAFTIWLVALGVRAFRSSIYAAALFLSIVPFFLLDNLHYVYGNGLAMFAIWLAMLDYHRDGAAAPAGGHETETARASGT